jgi:hypothetical protein
MFARTVAHRPRTMTEASTRYIALSLRVVAANTGPVSRRRAIRMAMPISVHSPATVPMNTAMRW